MNAIILAGGKGSRLMPLTKDVPKPMLDVAGKPIIDYVLSHLFYYGINNVVFSLGYKASDVVNYCKPLLKDKFVCVVESSPLGTCGGVKLAENLLDDVFVVVSGDCMCNVDLSAMIGTHKRSGAEATIAVTKVSDPRLYGVTRVGDDGRVVDFHEKPNDDRFGNLVNMGVYVINKSALSGVPAGTMYDFSLNLFPKLIEKRTVFTYNHDGYWSDVGDFKSYFNANKYFINHTFYPSISDFLNGESEGVIKTKSARVFGKITETVVGAGATVRSGVMLNNCVVLPGATAEVSCSNCIIHGKSLIKI